MGNIIGPQTFQAKDAPGYRPAKIAVMATQAGGAVVAGLLGLYYVWANMKKDVQMQREGEVAVRQETVGDEKVLWENLTDKENVRFRYVY